MKEGAVRMESWTPNLSADQMSVINEKTADLRQGRSIHLQVQLSIRLAPPSLPMEKSSRMAHCWELTGW